ncbi:MAG TPA: hypothetical protein VFB16_03350 [Bauldia sp.]|nr:hypothetical protein [Bauldia sp.]
MTITMRKYLLALSAMALLPLGALVLPATAQPPSLPLVAKPAGDAIDLSAIPVQPVVGPLAVKGVGDDDEGDDVQALGKRQVRGSAVITGDLEDGDAAVGEHEAD